MIISMTKILMMSWMMRMRKVMTMRMNKKVMTISMWMKKEAVF